MRENQFPLLQQTHLKDSKFLAATLFEHGTINWFEKVVLDLGYVIDYIFVDPSAIAVDSYKVETRYNFNDGFKQRPVSDHFPVVADIRFSLDR